jgi:hypothetical protein
VYNILEGNEMKRVLVIAGMLAVLAGCSTAQHRADAPLPSPTAPVTKDQTVAAAGKVEAPLTIDLPAWYIKAPASTEDYVYLAGTGISSDLSMSHQKALLDAQLKLADKINGEMNALVKQSKIDNSGTVGTDKTSINIKKVILKTALTGYHIEDSKIQAENRGYRTFVLIRYPMGDANRMLREKQQQERIDSEDAGSRELDQEMDAKRKPAKAAQNDVVVTPLAPLAQRAAELPHNTISDPKVKSQVEAAISRGDAVIMSNTVR